MAFGAVLGSRYQMAQNHVPGIISGTLRVPMTVQPGDSLWSLAQRYGNPETYILDRVDVLAQANKMLATSSLMPGQRIVVPVSNPAEISRLQRNLAKN
jgi:LysM repeat protein